VCVNPTGQSGPEMLLEIEIDKNFKSFFSNIAHTVHSDCNISVMSTLLYTGGFENVM